jgi:2-iminoacetate synthase
MHPIDERRIEAAMQAANHAPWGRVAEILAKAARLERLSLEEAAVLVMCEDPAVHQQLFSTASQVKDTIYGKRLVLFAPLYVSNHCVNQCLYCGFRQDNPEIARKHLSPTEIEEQTRWLLQRGHMRVLLVAGEAAPPGMSQIEFLVQSVEAIYAARHGDYGIKRVNVNCAPLSTEDFRRLKAAGIGTYQLFQETYHDATYRRVHPKGPKSDPQNRLAAIDRAFAAGIDDYGIGVLYGLYDWRFETLALLQHVEYLEATHGVGPHTLSVPRIEPAPGVDFSCQLPYAVSDDEFLRLVAILRIAVPYTGLILSTRETPEMRDRLFDLGISQLSAESSTAPGGYGDTEAASVCGTADEAMGPQFELNDHRTLDEMVSVMMQRDTIPSFCAACYRKDRTGEAFMHLAKPGHIKSQCTINALASLYEYSLDFASEAVYDQSREFMARRTAQLDPHSRGQLEKLMARIDAGERDVYV